MTYGLGNFYNGKQGKAETGLEISTLAIVDVDFNTAYHVSTRQTPDKCEEADGTRVDKYLCHFREDYRLLPKEIRVWSPMVITANTNLPTAYWNVTISKSESYAVMRTYVICTRANKNQKGDVNVIPKKS
jgi:hypothetical protein